HLVYRADLNRLEIWWRYANDTQLHRKIFRKTSTDGVNWSAKELLWDSIERSQDIVSPAVLYEDGKYKMWGIGTQGTYTRKLVYTESTDGKDWSPITICNVDWGGLYPWHGDVIKTDLGYEHIITAHAPTS